MSRWSTVLWRALVSLGQAAYPLPGYPCSARLEETESARKPVDLSSRVSVDAAFWSIVDHAQNRPTSGRATGRSGDPADDGSRSDPLFTFWPFSL